MLLFLDFMYTFHLCAISKIITFLGIFVLLFFAHGVFHLIEGRWMFTELMKNTWFWTVPGIRSIGHFFIEPKQIIPIDIAPFQFAKEMSIINYSSLCIFCSLDFLFKSSASYDWSSTKNLFGFFLLLGHKSDEWTKISKQYWVSNMNRWQSDKNGRMQTDSSISVACLFEDICQFINQYCLTILHTSQSLTISVWDFIAFLVVVYFILFIIRFTCNSLELVISLCEKNASQINNEMEFHKRVNQESRRNNYTHVDWKTVRLIPL